MNISLRKQSGGTWLTVILASLNDTTATGLSRLAVCHDSLRINGRNAVQITDGPGWTDVDVQDRGNEINTVSFSVTRTFTSIEYAELWMLKHKTDIRGTWQLHMTLGSGVSGWKWIYSSAVASVDLVHGGATVIASYEIVGGRIRQTPSDSEE